LDNNILETVNDKFVSSLSKYKHNWLEFKLTKEMKCLKNVSSYFRLDNSTKNINVSFENAHSVNIKLYNIHLNKKYECVEYTFNNIVGDNITITNKSEPGHYIIIGINCFETNNGEDLFKIKQIC
jgi:hypothetical protein